MVSISCSKRRVCALVFTIYPSCGTTRPCQSLCTSTLSSCSAVELAILMHTPAYPPLPLNALANCSALPTTACSNNVSAPFNVPLPSCAIFNATEATLSAAANGGLQSAIAVLSSFLLGQTIYLPAGQTQSSLVAQFLSQSVQLIADGLVSNTCRDAFAALAVQRSFLGCSRDPTTGIALPRLPCQSVCTTAEQMCVVLKLAVARHLKPTREQEARACKLTRDPAVRRMMSLRLGNQQPNQTANQRQHKTSQTFGLAKMSFAAS